MVGNAGAYYDIAAKDQFEELFGRFYIGSHPTPERNSYLILKFNFAMVNPEPEVLEQSFEEHTSICFDEFNMKYAHLLGEDYLEGYAQTAECGEPFGIYCLVAKWQGLPVYLIIDEYDNFTNVVLSRYGHDRYHALDARGRLFPFLFSTKSRG